jgi:hypothetical protein
MKFACFKGFFGFLADPWGIRGPFVAHSWPMKFACFKGFFGFWHFFGPLWGGLLH